jgi:uncharacterized protein with ParB-like and HNH nuclease domain
MSDSTDNIYDKYIDYDNQQLDTYNVGDEKVVKPITAENFEMNKRELGQVLTDQKFNIPEYQRLYSWENENYKQLWNDIGQFIESDFSGDNREASDVFFSSMYFAVEEDEQKYEVIDGQQRLTTIHILFRVIMEHLEEVNPGNITDDTLVDFQQFGIKRVKDILYVQENFGSPEPRLTLNKHDDEFFKSLIKGTDEQVDYLEEADYSIHGNNSDAVQAKEIKRRLGIERETENVPTSSFFKLYRSHRRLLNAYEFFDEKIHGLVEGADTGNETVRALVNILNYVYNSYHVGEYLIREAEPDFRMKIFEILNDRGVDLSKIDRIRAAVVNAFFDTDVKEEYIEKWEYIVVSFATDDDAIDKYLSVYLSIIDDGIDKIGEASAELLNAFHTQTIESDVKPRLRHLDEAKEFIDYAHELVDYYKHITSTELSPEDLKLADYTEQCQEILVRLNRQRMNQWRPFVLALYYHTNPDSKHEAERFYNVLDTIEKLNLRRLLASENSTIFRGVFIDAVEEFNLSPIDENSTSEVYRESQQFLINQMRSSSSSLFGDRFIDILAQSQSWNPETARLLFGKTAQMHFDENDSAVEQQLNMSNIHLEHVLPQTPVDDDTDPIWLRKFFKLNESPDTDIANRIERYIELVQTDDLTDEEDRLKDSIFEFIKQRFIDDIGNFILLRDSDNISASNRPFAEKVPEYYSEIEGYASIYPNRYFTAEYGDFDRDKLDRLREQHDEGGIVNVDDEVVTYFNSFWNYEALQERRIDLLLDILGTLQFDNTDDEFGIKSDIKQVRQDISRKTEQEFEKRLSVRSI